jgi:predicted amidohydrolase
VTVLRVAAVQASYVLMDRDATIDRVAALTASAAREGAQLVVFPEVFVPGTPVWIDTRPIWDGDEEWFGLLAENAVVIGGPASDRLAAIAAEHGVWLVVARENRMFVIGVNPVLHADQVPAGFPARDRLLAPGYLEQNGPWLEEGNTVVVAPDGSVLAGPVREREETLVADLDLRSVATARRHMDPVGHYHRPDIFRLSVDTSPRPAVTEFDRCGVHNENPV